MDEREARIREILAIKPINYGEVFTCHIAIPDRVDITGERRAILEKSLKQHGSNLLPLILRRTDKYGQDFEYEILYGEDIAFVAKKLEIERLWAWVFDLNDQQANAVREEFLQLVSHQTTTEENRKIPPESPELDEREVPDEPTNLPESFAKFKGNIRAEMKQFRTELRSWLTQLVSEIKYSLRDLKQEILSEIKAEIRGQLGRVPTQPQPSPIPTTQPTLQEEEEEFTQKSLERKTVEQLRKLAEKLKIKGRSQMRKPQLIEAILSKSKGI
ncbi:MAG: Rho termination factor N-terminal domain-containing protein [Geminocystis sp.]|nr:Rho termination factor N-terminal domain-containing protein [Geminocystis sp.]MCS7148282.1 Rho termination factor N-terminal domain-containing protein [Geminocystis sp.]MCX8077697.1 Rho termination factor N-terminal domain-containing protein [Geminocystis sp.]MDW8116589.1 Rho termination factor N-terminal domain-containing protein [Geminocystis sp.]MDW8462232.1 Rho termination factor N-terminal domain-containing protein [Geminocystis sp.]